VNRQFIQAALLLILFTLSTYARAADGEKTNKHCGSGFTESFIPEGILGCKFSLACKAHDTCYGVCDAGGSKFGTPYCLLSELSAERVRAKNLCDRRFFDDIDSQNNSKTLCRSIGAIYTAAVVLAGQGPFNGRPIPPNVLRNIALSSSSPSEAAAKTIELAKLGQTGIVDFSQVTLKDNFLQVPILDPDFKSILEKNGSIIIPRGLNELQLRQRFRAKQ
jgi:hypothetical protein